jgi:hypothetical protein
MFRRRSSFSAAQRLLAATVLCVSILVLTADAFAAAFVAQVMKARGDVRVAREGAGETSASIGTALQLGDVIKTGAGARVRLRFVDGSILALGENTALSIDLFAVDAGNKSRTVVLTLLEGIVNAAAAKSGEAKFDYQIKTANGYSAVRGTKWIVALQQALMTLYVLNGVVELGPNTGNQPPVMVNEGQWGSVDASGAISPPQPTTPEILKPVLDATGDTAMNAVPPATVPVPSPIQTPSDADEQNNRAFKGTQRGENGGGYGGGRGDTGKTGN